MNLVKYRKLKMYLKVLSFDKRAIVQKIIKNTPPSEERWLKLKAYFLRINPALIDNLFAWNIYKFSIQH